MPNEKILIVDDERDIVELVRFNLKREGYHTLVAFSGEEALSMAKREMPDLVVLDLMLPGIDGFEVTRRIRGNAVTVEIPIVMLTAKGEESDIVTGLEIGANDYISKPFSPRELVARIRGILRRRTRVEKPATQATVIAGPLSMDVGRHRVVVDKNALDLTHSEFQVLWFLVTKKGWVFTRGQIVDAVHGENYAVTERSVDVTIAGLRKKLGPCADFIETVRGVGYRFREEADV
ncbi:two-component DNA-binding response regulator [Desulforapulum autotrophicum HRM2]|uniref:Two-component DNA-binding response regulator n=1 Tax=Desulforapulum autotrophicum (strain ATCC 43914 / DSM 3382 / VKM B-1955 / HRM2) TaxID=177437 RepID=C0QFG8_DESAH|nr:response regulator transcription factor [Desulforapulum autotrophicum]ACN13364.1 two-component DNA-binding response regulator [Desulforapulum autotrophicum HRM2]